MLEAVRAVVGRKRRTKGELSNFCEKGKDGEEEAGRRNESGEVTA